MRKCSKNTNIIEERELLTLYDKGLRCLNQPKLMRPEKMSNDTNNAMQEKMKTGWKPSDGIDQSDNYNSTFYSYIHINQNFVKYQRLI